MAIKGGGAPDGVEEAGLYKQCRSKGYYYYYTGAGVTLIEERRRDI